METPSHNHAADAPCEHGCTHHHPAEGHAQHAPQSPHSHGPGVFFYLELAVILLWGALLIAFMVNGRVVNFVAPTGILREQALIGGLVLIVMAVFNFITRNQTCDCGHDHSHLPTEADGAAGGGHHHVHDESPASSRLIALLLLALPVGFAWAKSPDSYSPELQGAMANSITAQVNTGRSSMPKPAEGYTIETYRNQLGVTDDGPIPLDTQSFFYNGGDADMRKILEGQEVTVTGRVVKNTIGTKENRLRMYDLEVTCCAADARPFSFPIQFKGPVPEYVERGWYKVTGKATFEEERGNMISTLLVDDFEATTRPPLSGRAF